MNKPLRNTLRFVASVIVGLGILSGVLYFVGWRQILAHMQALGPLGILTVIGNVTLAMAAWIICWAIILRSYGIYLPWGKIIGARLSGYAITYLTPTLYFGGEPVRGLLVIDRDTAPATRVFATIIVERFLGGLTMIVFILFGSFYAIVSPNIPPHEKRLLMGGLAFVTFWILIGLINFAGNFKWISRAIRLLGRPLRHWRATLERAADKISETEDEVSSAFTTRWRATLLAFVVQSAATFFVYMRPQVFFFFSSGRTFDFPQLSLLFTLNVLLSFFLWITPGGLGTGEAGLIGVFHLIAPAVTSGGAVAYSLIFKFVESLYVGFGLYYLARRGLSLIQRRSGANRKEAASPGPPP
jgi:uncharacterized protein (TIRG00374 family)